MNCAACGAPGSKTRSHCAICGYAQNPDAEKRWDRSVEAVAYEDMQAALEPEEALLGVTRGRIAGSWRGRLTLNPQALLSPFFNLGLTGERLIIQHVRQDTGRATSDKAAGFPLTEIQSMALSDADPMEPGRTVRVIVQLASGETFRLRAVGRLADGASELVEVWESLSGMARAAHVPAEETCPHCGRPLDRPYRFCPFCGKEQGDA